jgi:hypothetical protein
MAGELAYRDISLYFQEQIRPQLPKSLPQPEAIATIEAMLKPELSPKRISRQWLTQLRQARQPNIPLPCPQFEQPLFIVCAPRAGSTLLFETLAQFAEVWTMGAENHEIERDIAQIHPQMYDYHSNRLTEIEATSWLGETVKQWFTQRLQNSEGVLYRQLQADQRPLALRFLEKTPKNALRIPFLKTIFPTAKFIYLYREPKANISSLLEGWRSRRFVAYRDLPRWPYREWSFLLPPDWESMRDHPLVEIAAFQWRVANETIRADLAKLPSTDWCLIDYDELTQQPAQTIKKLSKFANLQWTDKLEMLVSRPLPVSQMALSMPQLDKWRKHEVELKTVLSYEIIS